MASLSVRPPTVQNTPVLSSKNLDAPVTAEDIEKIATSVHGLYKNVDHKIYRVYLNKADVLSDPAPAELVGRSGKTGNCRCLRQFKRGREIMRIALIMLAAGNSRRFGGNKLLYEIDGNPMYRYILERLIAVAGAGGPVYINPHPDEGISSSLKIGLKANLDADACLLLYPISPGLQPGRSASLSRFGNHRKRNCLRFQRGQAWQSLYFYKEIL